MQKSLMAGFGLDTPPLDVAAAQAEVDRLEALLPVEAQNAMAVARAAKGSDPEAYDELTEKAWALVPPHQLPPLLDAWRVLKAAKDRNPEPVVKVAPAAPATPRNPQPGDEWVSAYTDPPSSRGTDIPSIPLPSVPFEEGQTDARPLDAVPRKAGRPRLYPDRVLTPREKARRYRQKRKAVAVDALSGAVDAGTLSHRDLCLAVARVLNQSNDLELRQLGHPLVRELQRRLKGLV